jgi:ABC-type branched-subunit amino acid transport system ATPase component
MTLHVEKVCISYGPFQAVSDASLTVPDGKLVGLIGPNGAGKSTLFSAISGLIVPSSGAISYRNEPLGALDG